MASRVHDIGHVSISDMILLKPGALTELETEIVRTHPLVGAQILDALEFPWSVKPAVRYHHERLDGSGYPEGLMGEEIPLAARVLAVADVIQIGARNTQNFRLLTEVGQTRKPVLLKRGASLTVAELLMAAEYIMSEGNHQVILCERGVRSFDPSVRNMLDLGAVPNIRAASHLPIVVDPSHATGRRDMVPPLALAAVAAGANGVMIEVHPHPEDALTDGPQSLHPEEFEDLMARLLPLAELMGREMSRTEGAGINNQ